MAGKGVLLVDDETTALKYFRRAFAHRFPVFSASSAAEALQVLKEHHAEIGVIVTDQRMPEATGVELLKIVRRQYPKTVRILTTAYSELDLLIEAINTGAVYSFVTKPWQLDDLERTLTGALEHYEKEIHNQFLLEQKLDDFRVMILEGRTHDLALIAAKVGHYVHNALCPVMLIIDELLENEGEAKLSKRFLENVRAHVREISKMLKDLVQISVPPSRDEFRSINLREFLQQSLVGTEILRAEKQITIEVQMPDDLPLVEGVPAQIERLFRFMIAEEVVSLSAGSIVQLRLSTNSDDKNIPGVTIEFEDFEPIPLGTVQDHLLHPFSVRGGNPRELGIFLASSYLIADHHGGSLNVTVKESNSLLFTIFLPCRGANDVDKAGTHGFNQSRMD